MKCESCKKKISIWNRILPWRTMYTLDITKGGKVVERQVICADCAKLYQLIVELEQYGYFDEMLKYKEEGVEMNGED